MSDDRPLVLVVDDDASVRRALGRLLRTAGYRAEPVESAGALWARDDLAEADCLILDVQLPDLNGLELQARILQRGVVGSIFFISGHGNIPMSVRALQAGAVDFLPKPFRDCELLDAVRRGVERSRAVRATVRERDRARALLATLTPREDEVMRQVVAGHLNKQIAGDLGATEATIKVHRGRVMQKLQVTSVADLVRLVAVAEQVVPGAGPAETGGPPSQQQDSFGTAP